DVGHPNQTVADLASLAHLGDALHQGFNRLVRRNHLDADLGGEVDQLFLEVFRKIARWRAAAFDLGHRHAGKAWHQHELVAQGNQLIGTDDGFDFLHASASFSSNQRNSVGNTTKVSRVEVIKPPMTTMASGRCTSEPGPVEK